MAAFPLNAGSFFVLTFESCPTPMLPTQVVSRDSLFFRCLQCTALPQCEVCRGRYGGNPPHVGEHRPNADTCCRHAPEPCSFFLSSASRHFGCRRLDPLSPSLQKRPCPPYFRIHFSYFHVASTTIFGQGWKSFTLHFHPCHFLYTLHEVIELPSASQCPHNNVIAFRPCLPVLCFKRTFGRKQYGGFARYAFRDGSPWPGRTPSSRPPGSHEDGPAVARCLGPANADLMPRKLGMYLEFLE